MYIAKYFIIWKICSIFGVEFDYKFFGKIMMLRKSIRTWKILIISIWLNEKDSHFACNHHVQGQLLTEDRDKTILLTSIGDLKNTDYKIFKPTSCWDGGERRLSVLDCSSGSSSSLEANVTWWSMQFCIDTILPICTSHPVTHFKWSS